MNTGSRSINLCLSFIITLSLILSAIQPVRAASQPAATSPAAQTQNSSVRYGYSDTTGALTFVGTDPSEPIAVAGISGVSSLSVEDQALGIIDQYAGALGLGDPSQELRLEKMESFDNRSLARYQQVYQGIPVLGGELVVNTQDEGYLLSLNGEVSPELALDTGTQFSAEQASSIALEFMQKWYPDQQAGFKTTTPELWIYDPRLLENREGPIVLGWRMEVTPDGIDLPIRELVLVDAQTGNVPLHFNQIDTGWQGQRQDPAPTDTVEPTLTPLPTETPAPTATDIPTETPLPTDTALPTEPPTLEPTATETPTETATPSEGETSAQSGATWYVATSGSDANDCADATRPCATINGAIEKAAAGDTIQVAIGTYTGTGNQVVLIDKSLAILGGWDPGFASQSGYSTVDGQKARTGVLVNGGSANASLDHLIIRDASLGVSNFMTLTIANSSIEQNFMSGIYSYGTLTLVNTTVSNNSAAGGTGGGIRSQGNLTLNNSTVSGNSASYGGGLYLSGSATIENSILAGNAASYYPDCGGTIISMGNNIIGNTSGCTVTAVAGDQFNVDPKLGTLLPRQGYQPLLASSPAINAGNPATCLPSDQRGVARVGICDIGAYEYTVPGTATALSVVRGSDQRATPFLAFAQTLQAVALDSQGSPVSNVTVTFAAPGSGASGTFAASGNTVTSALTDVSGVATASAFTANGQLGAYTVSASAGGVAPTNFSLQNASWFVSPAGNDSNSCASPASPCLTINAAIAKASNGDTIDVAIGTYTSASSPVVTLNKNVTLEGGWNVSFSSQSGFSTIDGLNAKQGVYEDVGVAASLARFIIRNAYGSYYGGGIYTASATLTLNNTIISDNSAAYPYGGGIYSASMLTLNNSSVSGNSAGNGGGIYASSGTLTLNNSTVSGNSADYGGGIYAHGAVSLNNSTVSGNSARFGGGMYAASGNITLRNSILGGNTAATAGPDCDGAFMSAGNNIISTTSGCTIAAVGGDKFNVNPRLGTFLPLQGYHPLLAGSPAIGAGNPATCLATDQRGLERVGTCDIGAYEYTTPGALARLSVAGGSGQRTPPDHAFPAPLRAVALDTQGSPVPNVSITFTAPASGPSGTFVGTGSRLTSVNTDPGGIAAAADFTANSLLGSYAVSASAAGAGPVAFNLENLEWFVSPAGNDANSCTVPASPCLTIDAALSKPGFRGGDTILVAQGTYTGSNSSVVTINKSAVLVGGWGPTFTIQIGNSIIDGQGARRGVTAGAIGFEAYAITMEHFVITNAGNEGGLYNYDGQLTLKNCMLSRNSGLGSGGGIYNTGTLTLTNCSVTGNTSAGEGGGIYSSGTLTLNYSTVSGNRAGSGGGMAGGPIYIHNSILANNSATFRAPDCLGSVTSVGHNIIGNPGDCTITAGAGDMLNIDPQTSAYAIAPGYYTLKADSPAIDAGDPASCPSIDVRGAARPHGAGCDIGAYEYTPAGGAAVFGLAGGSYQRAAPGFPFPRPFAVYVLDSAGSGMAGASVTFTAPGSGASGAFSDAGAHTDTVLTDSAGIAQTSIFTANSELGSYQIIATVSGLPGSVAFGLTNVAWYVAPTGSDSNSCASRAAPCATMNGAIGKAVAGDTVLVSQDTYVGSGSEPVVKIPKDITLSGGWSNGFTSQTGQSTIDGQNARTGVYLPPNTYANVVLDRFLITNGLSGVYLDYYSTLTLNNSTVSGNTDSGIYSQSATLSLNNSTVSGNTGYGGGGIYSLSGPVSLNYSTVSGNTASNASGGGILANGPLTVRNSKVSGNLAEGYSGGGGGIYFNGSTLVIVGSTIADNSAKFESSGSGGGILATNGTFTLEASTVSGNTASAFQYNGSYVYATGGGIDFSNGTLTIENSTISGNTANLGGGLRLYNGSANLNQVTISQNAASRGTEIAYGGGIYVQGTAPSLRNSLLAGNAGEVGADCAGPISSAGHNLIADADGCVFIPASGDISGTRDAPVSARLGDLRDNGGETFTQALLGGSPAIDAGDPVSCLPTDQRGVTRPLGAACDIGAFEGSETQSISGLVRTYSAANQPILPGIFQCDQTMPTCTNGSNPHSDAAQKYAIETHNLYLNRHGRASIDGNSMPILSTVHFDDLTWDDADYDNAYWSGVQMVYGDAHGWPLADDVVAHELTHGVTQHESNLFYYMESGAINESLSDLWGEYLDQTNGEGNDGPTAEWLIGEDVSGLGAFRSMSNPPSHNQPDRMLSTLFYKGTDDLGGVHQNSGVNNKAVFLMVESGTFNNKTVSPLGWDKTAAIYYEAQTHLLTTASDYADLYNLLYQSCLNLVGGAGGISSTDCQEVRDATDAVQMNLRPAGYRPQADFCPAGTSKTPDLFYDGLEAGDSRWVYPAQIGNPHWARLDIYHDSSSNYHLFGNDYDSSRDQNDQRSKTSAQLVSGIALASSGAYYLHFRHAFEFETYQTSYFDGAVLEYSTDNGATWKDSAPLFNAGQAYNGTIYPSQIYSDGNPLGGRSGFVGASSGYVSSRYNLSSLAGRTVKFRWVVGTDYTGRGNLGWAVDDVRIYKCAGGPSVPVLSAPATNALLTAYTPKLDWGNSTPAPHHYQLQLATSNTFASPVVDDSTLIISEYTVSSPLNPATTYYWRVRAFNEVGGASAWSAVRSFRTSVLTPVISLPVDAPPPDNLRPLFDWGDVPLATNYTIQVSKYSNLASPFINVTLGTSSYTPTTNLPPGIPLYWQVRANNAGYGPSGWARGNFTSPNPPSTPALLLPANSALSTDYTPRLDWANSTLPLGTTFGHYQLQVDAEASFASPDLDEQITFITASEFTPLADLTPNTRYYWRVRAFNDLDQYSAWSAVRSLRAAILPPTLVAPPDADPLFNKRPTLDWGDVTGASGYTLQIGRNTTFTSLQLTASPVASTFVPTADLPANTTFYWRVQAKGANGPSLWSAIRSFTTANPPSTPALLLPANSALTTDYTPRLDWGTSSLPLNTTFDYYQLQVATDAAFTSPVLDEHLSPITSSEFTPLADLTPNTQYYWRVRAFNTLAQYSAWSLTRSFRAAMLPPTLDAPDTGSPPEGLRPLFDWEDVTGATNYTLVVSAYANFSSPLVNATVPGSSYLPTRDLTPGRTLYWRVRANGPNGPSPWTSDSFITPRPPAIPALLSPANNSLTPLGSVNLTWKASLPVLPKSIHHYELQVDTNTSTFASPEVDETALAGLSYSLTLVPGNLYYWHVRAVDSDLQKSSWSAVWVVKAKMAAPLLVSPADLGTAANPVSFDWGDVSGASNYTIQVSTASNFGSFLLNTSAGGSQYTMTKSLPRGRTLYWRVRANGPAGPSDWSAAPRRFSIP